MQYKLQSWEVIKNKYILKIYIFYKITIIRPSNVTSEDKMIVLKKVENIAFLYIFPSLFLFTSMLRVKKYAFLLYLDEQLKQLPVMYVKPKMHKSQRSTNAPIYQTSLLTVN